MMPSGTPNEEVYLLNVNSLEEPSVYRANTRTRTWITQTLYDTQDIIYVNDVSRITDTVIQNSTAPISVDNVYTIGLNVNKDTLSSVTVFNQTKNVTLSNSTYKVVAESLSPVLKITDSGFIDAGDQLIITMLEGNLIYINGEQIKFKNVDLSNNTISGLQRGANITGQAQNHPKYSEVYGILPNNKISDVEYSQTWNSNTYNAVEGDPLQISTTPIAIFLSQDET